MKETSDMVVENGLGHKCLRQLRLKSHVSDTEKAPKRSLSSLPMHLPISASKMQLIQEFVSKGKVFIICELVIIISAHEVIFMELPFSPTLPLLQFYIISQYEHHFL